MVAIREAQRADIAAIQQLAIAARMFLPDEVGWVEDRVTAAWSPQRIVRPSRSPVGWALRRRRPFKKSMARKITGSSTGSVCSPTELYTVAVIGR
ncbi:MAG: hypothetical protein AAFV53_42745 [Myxococcota bacterium]